MRTAKGWQLFTGPVGKEEFYEVIVDLAAMEEDARTKGLRIQTLRAELDTLRGQRDALVAALRHVADKSHYGAETAGIIDKALLACKESTP